MKIVLAIVVYDRYANIEHWLKCLEKCDTKDVEVVIIHNVDTHDTTFDLAEWLHQTVIPVEYIELCENYEVKYILRENIGYDIGAFQDVCLSRLPGFPEFDRLLWVTDDVFPMVTNFIQQFNNAMIRRVGVSCMEISHNVKTHIRSNAFMIDKPTAERLTFPVDPVKTKRQCYEFEHMSDNTFFDQIMNMGLTVSQPWGIQQAPSWDSGYMRKLPRQKEHEKIFGPMPAQPAPIPKRIQLLNDK